MQSAIAEKHTLELRTHQSCTQSLEKVNLDSSKSNNNQSNNIQRLKLDRLRNSTWTQAATQNIVLQKSWKKLKNHFLKLDLKLFSGFKHRWRSTQALKLPDPFKANFKARFFLSRRKCKEGSGRAVCGWPAAWCSWHHIIEVMSLNHGLRISNSIRSNLTCQTQYLTPQPISAQFHLGTIAKVCWSSVKPIKCVWEGGGFQKKSHFKWCFVNTLVLEGEAWGANFCSFRGREGLHVKLISFVSLGLNELLPMSPSQYLIVDVPVAIFSYYPGPKKKKPIMNMH